MNVPHAVQPSLTIPPELYEPTFGSSYTCNIWSEWRVTGRAPTHQATHAYANDTYHARKSEAGVAMSASSADDTSHKEVSKLESKVGIAMSASSADSASS